MGPASRRSRKHEAGATPVPRTRQDLNRALRRDNELYVGHLRDNAALSKTPSPKVDPAAVVVIYLNGQVGGGSRIGVVFDKLDGKELAIVAIPGK